MPSMTVYMGARIYGPAMNIDTKDNARIGSTDSAILGIRFRAATSTTISGVVWALRLGAGGYSLGTGGTIEISIQTDDGTASHRPSGTKLNTDNVVPGNTGSGAITWTAFSSPPSITAGTLYHVVFTNVDADQVNNYVSINNVYTYAAYTTRQPAFANLDLECSYKDPTTWRTLGDTPDIDVVCADGQHLGSGYLSAMVGNSALITGTTKLVREQFTVSGGDRTVTAAWVRIGRQSGSGLLTIRLETGAGTLIEQGTVDASSAILYTIGADAQNGDWFHFTFASSHVLTNGQAYHLVLSTDGATQYSMVPIAQRDSSDDGTHYLQSRRFTDGTGQFTTDSGTTWTDMYTFDPENMQFYFVTA